MKTDRALLRTVVLGLLAAIGLFLIITNKDDRQGKGESHVGKQTPDLVMTLPELSTADIEWIAAGIFQNEAMSQPRYLTYWGKGEDFPSFGIGHFIWFPAGVDSPFDETFPDMIAFVRDRSPENQPLPSWIQDLQPFEAPWTDKQQFDQLWSSAEMNELREWLQASALSQARFIVDTFEQRWRKLTLPAEQKQAMTILLQNMAGTAEGLFAVIDYYNFKGLGDNVRERYQGQGWGLIQVLGDMQAQVSQEMNNRELLEIFTLAAAGRLRLRVELSPPERNEVRWLEGWLKRLDGYLEQ